MPKPPQTPHSSSTFPSQSQSPTGMFAHPHLVDRSWAAANAASVQVLQRSCQRHHRCRQRLRRQCSHHHTRPRRQVGCLHYEGSQSPAGMLVHPHSVNLSWAVADATSAQRSYAVVNVITDAVSAFVGGAAHPLTHAQERQAGCRHNRGRPSGISAQPQSPFGTTHKSALFASNGTDGS